MNQDSFEQKWILRTKWLTQMLIVSGALNIGFLATFVYFVLKDKNESVAFELKPFDGSKNASILSNEELIRAYCLLPYPDLLLRLDNKEQVEEGYTKRDIALSCLIAFHHFNLERALGGIPLQKRKISFTHREGGERIEMTVYPNLADFQFQAIASYAKTERWPLTSQGLFFEIQRSRPPIDATLIDAFSLTAEYHVVMTLFSRTDFLLHKDTLITLLSEGPWHLLQEFIESQRVAQDLSVEKRRQFLVAYLNARSPTAAKLILSSDAEFALKRLGDAQILTMLDLLKEKSDPIEQLCKDLLVSNRCDEVWKKATDMLYQFAGEMHAEPPSHEMALARFVPQAQVAQKSTPATKKETPKVVAAKTPEKIPPKGKRTHIVENGENLWKIARKYNTSVDAIIALNQLETEKLRPGKKLQIPDPAKKKI